MCSIICSSDRTQLFNLIKDTQHRGEHAHTVFEGRQVKEYFGLFDEEHVNHEGRTIVHLQAPTSQTKFTHPTHIDRSLLWHNGIIEPRSVRELSEQYEPGMEFDTKLIHHVLEDKGFDGLSDISGSFACLYLKNDVMYMFRSKHAQLYIDNDLTVCSERFSGSKCINYDTVYKIDDDIEAIDTFETKRFNIIVQGELDD